MEEYEGRRRKFEDCDNDDEAGAPACFVSRGEILSQAKRGPMVRRTGAMY